MSDTGTPPEARGYTPKKQAILKRLARIEGQARGIARMVDDDRYCIDVLTQINAIQNALDAVALELLDDHVRHCVIDSTGNTQAERTDELMDSVRRLLKSR